MLFLRHLYSLFFLLTFSQLASAHILSTTSVSLTAGFVHPFSGLDHLALMSTIGLWFAGQPRLKITLAFSLMFLAMLLGFTSAIHGIGIGYEEWLLALSPVCVLCFILLSHHLNQCLGLLAIMAFAVLHGHIHGIELSPAFFTEKLHYFLGFIGASFLIILLNYQLLQSLMNLRKKKTHAKETASR